LPGPQPSDVVAIPNTANIINKARNIRMSRSLMHRVHRNDGNFDAALTIWHSLMNDGRP
jgi:hypothetical protein